jgi:hypothetical protein
VERLYPLGEDGLDQNLLFGAAQGHLAVVMDIQTEGMEAQKQRYPAQVRDDRLFVVQHSGQHVVAVGHRVVVANQENGPVGKGPQHQKSSNVLVVGVEGRHGGVVPGHEGVGRHGIHVLRHQGGDHPQAGQVPAQLKVQGVVVGVVNALVTRPVRGAIKNPFQPGPCRASVISLMLWPMPKLVRYMCPATMKMTAIARWWWAISVSHRDSV